MFLIISNRHTRVDIFYREANGVRIEFQTGEECEMDPKLNTHIYSLSMFDIIKALHALRFKHSLIKISYNFYFNIQDVAEFDVPNNIHLDYFKAVIT